MAVPLLFFRNGQMSLPCCNLPSETCLMLPFVSCLCPTYNRFPSHGHLLGDAVEGYLRQTYPSDRRELVVLSDAPEQELVCDAPGVRVVNVPKRYASLGEKRNAMVEMARGDLLACWDDDDLALSWRLSQSVEMLGSAGYWKPNQVVFLPHGGKPVFKHSVGVRHHASIFTREAWKRAGGYPHVSGSEDAGFDARLRATCRVAPEGDLLPSQWAYVYRFGVSPCHVSGVAGGPPNDPHAPQYKAIGERMITSGRFKITPSWMVDYEQLVLDSLPKNAR